MRSSAHATAYRPDIDGLRMVAVVPVVLFHLGVPGLAGGFVGVDVFFVISGYLITSIITAEMARGSFTLAGFYERRCRRILPALFAVVLASLAAGAIFMLPGEFEALSRSAIATTLFASNLYFWRDGVDYFGVPDYLPLLHTWSLAIEEQFYIGFPILLMLLARFGRHLVLATTALMVVGSFALAAYMTLRSPAASFFLIPTRAWELGLGALLALMPGLVVSGRVLREGLALVAALCLLLPVLLYDGRTAFPGLAALPPCLGAALVILLGRGGTTMLGRVLALRPFVFVGLISYSLYLWHWPVLAFLRLRLGTVELELATMLAALGLIAALSIASWRFVERPFRRTDAGRARVLGASAAGIAALAGVAGAVVLTNGLPQRLDPAVWQTLADIEASTKYTALREECFGFRRPDELCQIGADPEDSKQDHFLIWGDSHALSVAPALAQAAGEIGATGRLASYGTCAPLPGVVRPELPLLSRQRCSAFAQSILADLKQRDDIEIVFLLARWPLYVEGTRAPGEAGKPTTLECSPEVCGPAPDGNAEMVTSSLAHLVKEIRATGRTVVLIESIPEIGFDVPRQHILAAIWGNALPSAPNIAAIEKRAGRARAILDDLARREGVTLMPTAELICNGICATHDGDTLFWRDDDHLTETGALRFLKVPFAEALAANASVR